MPDPKLKAAMAEIKAVLRKHDIAGCINLASATHTEYLMEIDPSWSCAFFEWDENDKMLGIRFRSLSKDYKSKKEQRKHQEDTLGMLLGFHDMNLKLNEMLMAVVRAVCQDRDVVHRTIEDGVEPPDDKQKGIK